MPRRQRQLPTRWLITDERLGTALYPAVRRLSRGSGVLVRHHELPPGERAQLVRRLRRIASERHLVLVDEAQGAAARVHSPRELARARLAGKGPIFLSPLFQTRTHPDWEALPRMRAAAIARLAGRQLLALGGMNERRYAQVRRLGFAGWAGIDAWAARKRPFRASTLGL